MDLAVLGQVVAPGEALAAEFAGVGLDPGVRAPVPGELVRAAEAPATPGPRARERLLPSVPAQVGLQVRCLRVNLRMSIIEYTIFVLHS